MPAKKKVTKKKKVPVKTGRPPKYKPEFCALLIEHMESGLSFESFAGLVKVAISTIDAWVKQYEEFRGAKKLGEAQCRLFWEKLGRAGTLGQIKGFNTPTYIFNMKNRFGWSDRTDLRISAETENFEPEFSLLRSVSRDELMKLARAQTNNKDVITVEAKDATKKR